MQTIEAIFSLAWKDWLRYSRQPFLVIISVVIPLVFIFFYGIIVPSSSTNPVAVALEGDGPLAQAFLHTLLTIHSQESAYYEVLTTDAEEAKALFDQRNVMGLIVIPSDFDEAFAAGNAQVQLRVNNINSDYSKNLRLRLDYAVLTFAEEQLGTRIAVDESTYFTADPTMQNYVSTSLLLFACIYSAMVNTGLQVASEWNDRTIKTLLLAPVNRGVLIAGKIVAGLGQSVVAVALVLIVLMFWFDFRIAGSIGALAGIVGVVMLLGAVIGALVGVASKKTLASTTILITLSIVIFLISGNEDSIRGLAWHGPIVVLWQISRFMPTTYAFLAARSLLLTADTTSLVGNFLVVLLATVVVAGLAQMMLTRAYSQLPGGQ